MAGSHSPRCTTDALSHERPPRMVNELYEDMRPDAPLLEILRSGLPSSYREVCEDATVPVYAASASPIAGVDSGISGHDGCSRRLGDEKGRGHGRGLLLCSSGSNGWHQIKDVGGKVIWPPLKLSVKFP